MGDRKTRWGILATGWIAELFTSDLLLTGHSVVAVGSRTAQGAKAFADKFGIANVHGSYEALVGDPEVDVVYIATPHPYHYETAVLALQAGKHVLVEKPFMLNADQAAEVLALANAKGLIALEAMWTRFLPHMRRIAQIIENGELGEVRAVIADHTQKLPSDPAHRLNNLELGGGALLDLGIYPVSFAWQILGKPAEILSSAVFRPTGADAQVATIFRYASGAIATSMSSSEVAGPNRASVVGSLGKIEIDPVWYQATGFHWYDNSGKLLESFNPPVEGRGMSYQADHFEHLIASGDRLSTIMPAAQTLEIMQGLDDIRRQIGLIYPGEAKSGQEA